MSDDQGTELLTIRAKGVDDRKPLQMITGEQLAAFDELAAATAHMFAAKAVYDLAVRRVQRASLDVGRAPR